MKSLKPSGKESLSQNLKNKLMFMLNVAIKIISILLFILCIRWAGIKGIISMLFGMAIMAYIMLSGNQLLMFFVKIFGNKEYLVEIMGKNETNEKEN